MGTRMPRGSSRRWAVLLFGLTILGAILWGQVAAFAVYNPADPWALPPETAQKGVKTGAFQNPDSCARCHPNQYGDWTKSMHRQYGNAAFQWAFETASKDTAGKVDGFCPRCHSPVAVLAGEKITPGQYKQLSAIAQKGVQCDFCHTLKSVSPNWPGNGSFVVEPGRVKRGPIKDATAAKAHESAYSALFAKADFCGMCHNLGHPGTNLQLESTYSEWSSSDYAKKGTVCQACHMPARRGQAAQDGPMRSVHAHTFVGANVRGADAEIAVADLKKAAKLEVTASKKEINYGQPLKFTVKITNVGAGHYLPTGITELRQMWLEFRVLDANGRSVLSKDQMFNTVLEDANGIHDGTVPIWKAVKVYSDNRIAPGTTEDIPIEWKVPYSLTKGDLKVTSTLKYRSLPEEFAAQAKLADNPVTIMAEAVPLTVKVKSSVFGWVVGVFTAGLLGGTFFLPVIVLVVWLILTAWLVVVATRSRSKSSA